MTFNRAYCRFLIVLGGIYAALLAPLVACEDLVPMTCVDGAQCVTGLDGPVEVTGRELCGMCRPGTLDCSSDRCVGEVGPTDEVCDGRDNDCDCETDEDVPPLPPGHSGSPCGACGPCADADAPCSSGQHVCAVAPQIETCDLVDNDCDCETDELPVLFFYSGPPETAGVGVCRPGVEACVEGDAVSLPEILPADEDLCFDGLDNDCDGRIDEADVPTEPRSVVLLIDTSGSMAEEMTYLRQAVCTFAARASPGVLMAAVAFAVADVDRPDGVLLVSDFDTPDTICSLLFSAGAFGNATAAEFQPDAFVFATGLTWPSSDRAAVVLTDETVQPGAFGLVDVQTACRAHRVKLYVASKSPFTEEWLPSVAVCGGDTTDLSNPYTLQDSLMEWFEPECAL